MQCCKTCKYIESTGVWDNGNFIHKNYFCGYPVKLPEIMVGTILRDYIDDPDQYGGDCECYKKARKKSQ